MFMFTGHSISAMCQEVWYTFLMHHFRILSSQTLIPSVATASSSRHRNRLGTGYPLEIMFVQAHATLWCEAVKTAGIAHEQKRIRTNGYRFHFFPLWVISSKMHLISFSWYTGVIRHQWPITVVNSEMHSYFGSLPCSIFLSYISA